jgi:hypothetical protein
MSQIALNPLCGRTPHQQTARLRGWPAGRSLHCNEAIDQRLKSRQVRVDASVCDESPYLLEDGGQDLNKVATDLTSSEFRGNGRGDQEMSASPIEPGGLDPFEVRLKEWSWDGENEVHPHALISYMLPFADDVALKFCERVVDDAILRRNPAAIDTN